MRKEEIQEDSYDQPLSGDVMPTKTDNDTLALACERYLRASGQEKDIVSMVKRMREVEQETELRIGLAIAGSLYDRVAYGN